MGQHKKRVLENKENNSDELIGNVRGLYSAGKGLEEDLRNIRNSLLLWMRPKNPPTKKNKNDEPSPTLGR